MQRMHSSAGEEVGEVNEENQGAVLVSKPWIVSHRSEKVKQ